MISGLHIESRHRDHQKYWSWVWSLQRLRQDLRDQLQLLIILWWFQWGKPSLWPSLDGLSTLRQRILWPRRWQGTRGMRVLSCLISYLILTLDLVSFFMFKYYLLKGEIPLDLKQQTRYLEGIDWTCYGNEICDCL